MRSRGGTRCGSVHGGVGVGTFRGVYMEGWVHGGVGTSWSGRYMEGWVHGGVGTWRGGYMEGWVHHGGVGTWRGGYMEGCGHTRRTMKEPARERWMEKKEEGERRII